MEDFIPFFKPSIGNQEVEEVVDTLRSGWLTTGQKCKHFEAEFAAYMGLPHAVAVNSCTAALHLALEASGLQPGEAVLVPTMTFAATAEVVRYFNAIPIFIDCESTTMNMDLAKAEEILKHNDQEKGAKIRAIMPVHYGGQMVDMTQVERLAKRYSLTIVEDAAHALPAFFSPRHQADTDDWEPVGQRSHVACFSFYANKTITTGEGGMAITRNADWAERMRIMSLHGISKDAWERFSYKGSWYYEIVAPGYKYNMTDIVAAIGIHQLKKADYFWQERRRVASLYGELLKDIDEIELPQELPNCKHSWHLYVIKLNLGKLSIDRNRFVDELKTKGIGVSVHWMPLHMHPYYRDLYGYKPEDFQVACSLYHRIISLPIYPSLTDGVIAKIAGAIKATIALYRK